MYNGEHRCIKNNGSADRLSEIEVLFIVASRRSSEELIFQGRVTVNGSVCKTPQVKFRNAPMLQNLLGFDSGACFFCLVIFLTSILLVGRLK